MNSKMVMAPAAIITGILGLAFLFAPKEIMNFYNATSGNVTEPFIQLLGAALLGLAVSNWIAKHLPMGGIYGRPIMAGNLAHFGIGFFSLAKSVWSRPDNEALWILLIVYALFSIAFGVLIFYSPKGS